MTGADVLVRRLRGHGVPVVFGYALWVYLMQFLSWNGTFSLLEQHAFLVPAPLMNL